MSFYHSQYPSPLDQVVSSLGNTQCSLIVVFSWFIACGICPTVGTGSPNCKNRALGDARGWAGPTMEISLNTSVDVEFPRLSQWMLNRTTGALPPQQDFNFLEDKDCFTDLCHSTAPSQDDAQEIPGFSGRDTSVLWERLTTCEEFSYCQRGQIYTLSLGS